MPESVSTAFLQALSEMDAADLQKIEQGFESYPVSEVAARIASVKGQFFAVDFARKTDKKVNGVVVEAAGSVRHMVCRRGVAKYVKGVQPEGQRKNEDAKHDVLTVWDVGVYQTLRKAGAEQASAGEKSYRRINMVDVKAISIPSVTIEQEQERVAVQQAAPVEV